MIKDFVLALALICPSNNDMVVEEILITKPVTFCECNKLMKNPRLRQEFETESHAEHNCHEDLVCIRMYWKGRFE